MLGEFARLPAHNNQDVGEPTQPTEIIRMPNRWLNRDERNVIAQRIFTPEDIKHLRQIREFNQAGLASADAIFVIHQVEAGYLGEGIEESRLAGLLDKRYPGKVFVITNRQDFLGKFDSASVSPSPDGVEMLLFTPHSIRRADRLFAVSGNSSLLPYLSSGKVLRVEDGKQLEQDIPIKVHSPDLNDVENIHMLHELQVMWELLYGGEVDELPGPAIKTPAEAEQRARKVFNSLKKSRLNVIIHPDASSEAKGGAILFIAKSWPADRWASFIAGLRERYQDDVAVFISVGSNHPQESLQIDGLCSQIGLQAQLLPRLSLAEYTGLVNQFSKNGTIFVGTESMPASHLAPSLGLKSIVLGHAETYIKYYGPWGGLAVVGTNPDFTDLIAVEQVSVDRVLEAAKIAHEELLTKSSSAA